MNQEVCAVQLSPLPIIAEIGMGCPWCLAEYGLPPGEGSHGICKRHADGLLVSTLRKQRLGNRHEQHLSNWSGGRSIGDENP